MVDSKTNPWLSCAVCHGKFLYKDLIIEDSWDGKWKVYLSPCCRTEQWMLYIEALKENKYLLRSMREVK